MFQVSPSYKLLLVARGYVLGRGGELALICQGLHGARAGRGGLALVCGEPGIGKTSLLIAAAAEARRNWLCCGLGALPGGRWRPAVPAVDPGSEGGGGDP